RLAGLTNVDCRRLDMTSSHPDFLRLLVEYNRQRVKSFDERLREEVACADPEEAHRLLIDHRHRRAHPDVELIPIRGVSRVAAIWSAKRLFLAAIRRVIRELKAYWPLSDRQIHYALLNDPPLIHASKPNSRYANDSKSYKACTELLTRARLKNLIPWGA